MTMVPEESKITIHRRCASVSEMKLDAVIEAEYATFGIYTGGENGIIGTGSPRMAAQMLTTSMDKKLVKHDDPANFVYALNPRLSCVLTVNKVRSILNNLADEISYGRKMYKECLDS